MKISVIVPAYNEEKVIGASLRSIDAAMAAFRSLGWQAELIVCDNNSTDRTAELARAGGATVVFEAINQISRARNSGAAAAQGDWLVFVDADSHPSAALFTELAEKLQTGRCLAGGCTLKLDEGGIGEKLVTESWNYFSRFQKWCAGSFLFCEAAAFRELGGFSLELFASEEIDLSKRLKKLAAQRGKQLVILHRHPLVTSARKMHLYSSRERFAFLRNFVLRPKATLGNREACGPWYDGRR